MYDGQPTIVSIRGGYDKLGHVWRKKRYPSVPYAIRAMLRGLSLRRAHDLLQVLQADVNQRAHLMITERRAVHGAAAQAHD